MRLVTVPVCRQRIIVPAVLTAFALLFSNGVFAAGADGSVEAFRLDQPVQVDGRLDESAWQGPSVYPLVQNEPENGADPRQQTRWWIAYDDDALYVAACLNEDDPDSIRSRLGRRDTWPESDWVYLNLDTFNDDRNAYSLSVNPDGVIGDSALYNDGWSDNSWDGVWDAAASIHDNGWCVEMRIPFSQLSFPNADEQVWGINFSRRYSRCQGREELFHKPRNESGYMNRFPDLVGIRGIAPSPRLEALVYGTARAEMIEVADGNPFHDGSTLSANTGLDLSWGLSSNLNLDATVNPDFGQVEVDPAVVNLSDFETYFQERRPFFVKEANTFRFGQEGLNNNVGFNFSDPMLMYSRRVGRAPSLALDGHDYADVPAQTTILGAAKLTGKIGNTFVGVMSAATAEETARLDLDGVRSNQTVEPFTSYNAARIKHVSSDGMRGLGMMVTHVERDLTSESARAQLTDRASVVGVDGWTNLDSEKDWAMRGYMSMSRVSGSAGVIEGLQLSSRRYYQRPDADHVTYDPTRTDLGGWAGRVMVNKESGNITFNSALGAISPGYEINDMGFQYRADQINTHIFSGYNWSEPRGIFRNRGFAVGWYKNWDFGGTPDQHGAGLFYDAELANYWFVNGMVFYNPERNNYRLTRGGPIVRMTEYKEASIDVSTDRRKSWQISSGVGVWSAGDGSGGSNLSGELELQPAAALRLTLGARYSITDENTQWVGNFADDVMTSTAGVRYVFGRLDYEELSFPVRVDWTFSPKLTLQSYVQPLFAVGSYSEFKEFARPGTYDFNTYGEDGGSSMEDVDGGYLVDPDGAGPAAAYVIDDPDFNFKSLKVNAVLRWEYRPGSTFYFVWTQDRMNFDDPGSLSMRRDVDNLLESPGDDIFMVKITSWLDF